MSCSLLLYATTDNNASFTFPECQKAAKNLSPGLETGFRRQALNSFRERQTPKIILSRPRASG